MPRPVGYVDQDYLELVNRVVKGHKERTYELMRIQPGHTVLDVGCGPGTDTIPIAALVGDSGKVVGVDYDAEMIAEADRRAAELGMGVVIEHHHEDATSLPFDADHFDSSRSERLFQHLPEPQLVLTEMVRVTKRCGWIVVLDTDWSTLSVDTRETDIELKLKQFRIEHRLHNGLAGRQLYRLFKEAGLTQVSVEMAPICVTDYAIGRQGALLDEIESEALKAEAITEEELERWHHDLEQADANGVHFASISQVMVAGCKPLP